MQKLDIKFRKDINILRALAVIIVVLFHFKFKIISGGFIGVDIFFVISGYLMTSIILKKFHTNTFSLKQFYISRFNRIVPALLFMTITFLVIFFFVLFNNEFRNYVNSLIYTLTFTSNIYFYKRAIDYFGSNIYSQYLLHTWSLAVEFQFYILYPLILILCKKIIPIKYIKYSILTLFIGSLTYSLIESCYNPTLSYYILTTRAWQLLAGALVFSFPLKIRKYNKLLHYVFFFAILISSCFIKDKMAWPGFYSIIPILLTICFLYTNYQTSYLTNNRVLNYIGKISYSLYLYHWPLVIICTFLYDDFILSKPIFIAFSIIFASFSYHFIEQRLNKKLSFVLFIIFLFVLILGNQYIQNNNHMPKQIEQDLYKDYHPKQIPNAKPQSYVYIAGDSFAERITRLVDEVNINNLHYTTLVSGVIRCYVDGHLMGYRTTHNSHENIEKCKTSHQDFSKLLQQEHLKGYIVIWTRRWEIWVNKGYIKNYNYFLNNKPLDVKNMSKKDFENIVYTSIDKTLETLNKKGAKVIIILQAPRQKLGAGDLYKQLFRWHNNSKEIINQKLREASISKAKHIDMQKAINDRLIHIASKYENVSVLDPTPFMCDKDKCLIGTASKSFYIDDNHISRFSGADEISTPLKKLIIKQK
ncbi:acyltransferase [Candidatus Hepatincola sp. Av]